MAQEDLLFLFVSLCLGFDCHKHQYESWFKDVCLSASIHDFLELLFAISGYCNCSSGTQVSSHTLSRACYKLYGCQKIVLTLGHCPRTLHRPSHMKWTSI
ncbi:hypothetical protein C8R45DRAFT_961399 [Mycena sanguinolenta]|nr:hypothetical protein C8R45DRAFT_961399 [Mycena sanguinolenta]